MGSCSKLLGLNRSVQDQLYLYWYKYYLKMLLGIGIKSAPQEDPPLVRQDLAKK